MGLRKNVAIGFSPEEFLRLKGAAALARMPVSTYVKWLLQGSPVSQRELISKNLKERGIPSSTIRQVDIVLDELEKSHCEYRCRGDTPLHPPKSSKSLE